MSERAAAEPAAPEPLRMAATVVRNTALVAGPVAAALILVAVPGRASGGAIETFVATGLIGIGAVAWAVTLRTPGGVAIAAGACLGLVAAADTVDASALDRALGAAATPLLAPLLAIAVTRTPLGWVALAAGAAAGPVRALVYDPFLDPGCTERCVESPLALSHHGTLAAGLLAAGTIVAAAALTLVALGSARRWQLVVVAAAGWAVVLDRALGLIVVAAAVSLLVVTSDVVERTTARRRLDRLVRAFRTTGHVQETLRRELGDDTLIVAYRLDDESALVTRDGSPVDPPPHAARSDVRIGGEPVAQILHAPGTVGVEALTSAIDGSARIALDNERLAAQVSVQLSELRASRARIVRHADEERRRIERDVHDGAQQHVLALGLELQAAVGRLAADDPARRVLERCIEGTAAVLDELRELSHGIHPASLEAGGLALGLRTLAARSRHPLRIVEAPTGRFDGLVERAAFSLVADAERRADGPLDVVVRHDAGVLVTSIAGAGPVSDVVVDRIRAAGGSLEVDGDTIVASFPCAPSSQKTSS